MLTAEMPTTAIVSSTQERPAAARKRLHVVSLTVLTDFVACFLSSSSAAPNTSSNSCSHLHYPPIKEQLRVVFSCLFLIMLFVPDFSSSPSLVFIFEQRAAE